MKYIIFKSSRSSTTPYGGPSCQQANVPVAKVYTSYEEALRDAQLLTQYNPVGFLVAEVPDDYKNPYDTLPPPISSATLHR